MLHQVDPDAEAAYRYQQVNRQLDDEEQPVRDRTQHDAHDHPYNPEGDPRQVKENRLKGMETYKAIILEGINHQEQDSSDGADQVGQRTSNIGGKAGSSHGH